MKILILGGDGFCGWPTALHLSALGHDITIADNLSRRAIDRDLGTDSLTPISTLPERVNAWSRRTSFYIGVSEIDVARDYRDLIALIRAKEPEVIIHFAEQRAAPFSMKSPRHKRYTVNNNVNATHNVLAAIVESELDIHLVHLGTMGVYGYGTAGVALPEGYLSVRAYDPQSTKVELTTQEIRYPSNPGSVYHMTKCLDAEMFAYYAKNDRLRITDLHQGIIWGTHTQQTMIDERLINRFDYDGDYGTVLNRFLVQAAVGYPLTVHGTGGQTRAFIHIQDSVRCIELAIENPPARGDRVQIRNQMTETHRVRDLAMHVASLFGGTVDYVDNPRNEAPENELMVSNKSFLDLGLHPTRLSDQLLREAIDIAQRFSFRIDRDKIPCTSRWIARPLSRV